MLRETLAKVTECLYVAVRPVYVPVAMAEVNVRHDKYTAAIQEPRYFGEFLGLKGPYIFKETLGNDDVETLVIKPNRHVGEIGLDQIRCRVMDGYIDTVVFDI
jgi:hypothetical protein